jgi:hypothetical protein
MFNSNASMEWIHWNIQKVKNCDTLMEWLQKSTVWLQKSTVWLSKCSISGIPRCNDSMEISTLSYDAGYSTGRVPLECSTE